MAITNQERVGKAMELHRAGLAPFVEREFKSQHQAQAADGAVTARLPETYQWLGIVDAVVDGLPLSIEPIDRRIAASAAALRASHGRSLRLPSIGARIELIGGS